ncbi:MAG: hypothetical protein ACQEQC_00775 [Elusimicrobiota bacterium]
MKYLNIIVALFIMAVGMGYLARPDIITKFNEWMRENLFSDRLLLRHRRKVGTLLLFMGAVLFYMIYR